MIVMNRCDLKIELMSDMCVSDGGVYNSSLDTDVVYDSYGFPYIPAKRIKGCLREIALELKQMGLDVDPEILFGSEGNSSGKVRVSDALLKDVECYRDDINKSSNMLVFHPQNVLNYYTYIRTQTSIDYDYGVAEDASLRNMRVVKKGNTFLAKIEIDDESVSDAFRMCCTALRHMGLSRTRGLGEIRCSVVAPETTSDKTENDFALVEGANRLYYTIDLKEPVIIKSINGGEERSLDYIDGSKVLGVVAEKLKRNGEDVTAFIESGKLFFSNAYIEDAGERMVEVPASLYSVKDNDKVIIDGAIKDKNENDDRQINQIKHCYVSYEDGKIKAKKSVKMEDRYHHRRPDDKSIGRALKSDDNSDFYSMSSICAGQRFRGFIHGAPEQIKKISELIAGESTALIGYSRMSEYGQVEIKCVESEKRVEEKKAEPVDSLNILLESPAIIYNDNAMYSLDQNVLIREILTCLGINCDKSCEEKSFINYGQVGGFNVTWGYRKPIVGVFEKGSFIHIDFEEPQYISIPENFVIGERTLEGFGEVIIVPQNNEKEYELKKSRSKEAVKVVDASGEGFAKSIADMLFEKYVPFYAVKLLDEFDEEVKEKDKEKYRPTVSNMILMCSESSSLQDVKISVKERYDKASEEKKEKERRADKIIKLVEKYCCMQNDAEKQNSDISNSFKDNINTNIVNKSNEDAKDKTQKNMIEEFEKSYSISNYSNPDSQMLLLKEFLKCLKYSIRERKAGDKNEQ